MKKFQDIKLKNGMEVTADWNSRHKCKGCKKDVFFAATEAKIFIIELVGLAQWNLHSCKVAA